MGCKNCQKPTKAGRSYCSRTCGGKYPRVPVEVRLDAHIDKRGPDECWPWQGRNRHKQGYGRISFGGASEFAHRVALHLHLGDNFDQSLDVLHLCDNPPCCNPKHLYQGTHQENMRDMKERLRARHGNTHPYAKITDADARRARDLYGAGLSTRQIAAVIGIGKSAAHCIVAGKTWRSA